jgi:Protein of unknown function (DUF3300)
LKDKALADAVEKQNWDPSVQALAALPEAVKQLSDNIKWTTDLGNAVLAQESDVLDAVQRMRKKAQDKGALKSTEQQKVETQVVEGKQTIVVQPSSTEVVYVPSYNPTVVYGAPIYPYPSMYYPPAGYYAGAALLSFGVGVAMGAFWSGGWGWGAGWGGGTINVNNNNSFVRNSNTRQGVANANRGNSTWRHNPQHRGGAPYSNSALANKYGGTARGDSLSARQSNARQNLGNSSRGDLGGRANGAGNFGGAGGAGGNLGGRSGGLGGDNGFGGGSRRGGDRSGSSLNRSALGGGGGGFGGGGGGRFNGGAARASGSRGASSVGGSRGGGGRGGGRRR